MRPAVNTEQQRPTAAASDSGVWNLKRRSAKKTKNKKTALSRCAPLFRLCENSLNVRVLWNYFFIHPINAFDDCGKVGGFFF